MTTKTGVEATLEMMDVTRTCLIQGVVAQASDLLGRIERNGREGASLDDVLEDIATVRKEMVQDALRIDNKIR